MKLAAQILGVLALGENAFIFLSRKRERILQLKLLSDLLWMGNYLLLGAYTGAALNGIAILRELVFLQRDRRRWADAPWWPVFFAAFSWISPVLEWVRQGRMTPAAHSPDPWAVCSLPLRFTSAKPLWTKLLSIAGNLLWMIYAGIVGNPSGLLSSGILLVSALLGLFREQTGSPKSQS